MLKLLFSVLEVFLFISVSFYSNECLAKFSLFCSAGKKVHIGISFLCINISHKLRTHYILIYFSEAKMFVIKLLNCPFSSIDR